MGGRSWQKLRSRWLKMSMRSRRCLRTQSPPFGLAVAGLAALSLFAVPGVAFANVGSISGRVTHGGSEPGPVPELLVCALQNEEEEAEVFGQNCGYTSSNGDYTIPNLPSGNYKIEFRPFNYWVFEYYNDTRQWSQAQWIEVTDSPVVGINAELTKAGYIDGSVTRASDGEPLSEVLVCAEEPLQEFTECAESGEIQGSYQLATLLEGNYVIEFLPVEGQGVRAQFYNGKSESSEADLVHVTPGSEHIDAALLAEATITGRVTDAATNSGLGEIEVCAFELDGAEVTVCEYTEPSGSYVLTDLPTGSYIVGFFSGSEEEEELGLNSFPAQFWSDKTTWETADILTLELGTTTGINAELDSQPLIPPSNTTTLRVRPTRVPTSPTPTAVTPAPAPSGRSYAARVAHRKGSKVLLRLRCQGSGRCRGLVKLRVGHKLIGKARFAIAAHRAKVLPVKLNLAGKKLLRRAHRHRLKVKLSGRNVKPRVLVLE